MHRKSLIWTITSSELQKLLDSSCFYTEIFARLGLTCNGSTLRSLKFRINQDGLNTVKLNENRRRKLETSHRLSPENKIPLDKILVENSTYRGTTLRNRLINEGVLVEKCRKCGLGPWWNGEPLTLQLDHINGNNTDNRIENLRIVCPNCHTQTPTFAGRNLKKASKPKQHKKEYHCADCGARVSTVGVKCRKCRDYSSCQKQPKKLTISDEELINLVKSNIPYLQIGKKYGVSQTAIRKRCKKLGIYVNRKLPLVV